MVKRLVKTNIVIFAAVSTKVSSASNCHPAQLEHSPYTHSERYAHDHLLVKQSGRESRGGDVDVGDESKYVGWHILGVVNMEWVDGPDVPIER